MNKHLRILIAILLVAVMVLGVVGCAKEDEPVTSDTTAPTDTTPDDTTGGEDPEPEDPKPEDPNNKPTSGTWEFKKLNYNTKGVNILGERNLTTRTDNGIWLDWAGSGIDINLNLDGKQKVRFIIEANADCYFKVYLDGQHYKNGTDDYFLILGQEEAEQINLVDVLGGVHNIKIVKVNDYATAVAEVLEVAFVGDIVETPTADKELYVEFVGDGITTGKGLMEGAEDATKAYAYLAAEKLGADYAITALDGYGLVYDEARDMAAAYLQTSPRAAAKYKFEREADVVVLNIGTVDYADDALSEDDYAANFQAAYLELLNTVRASNNKQTKIICLYNACNDTYSAAILAAAQAFGGEAKGVYTVKLDATKATAEEGIAYPTAEEQAAYAEAVVAKINAVKDVKIQYPIVSGDGVVKDWADGVVPA